MKPEDLKEQELNEEQLDEATGGLLKKKRVGEELVQLEQDKKYWSSNLSRTGETPSISNN